MSGKYPGETLSDDESALDISELPIEYRIKLNGFLRSACHDGHETLTRILLDKGADVNYITPNTQLSTALHVAVSSTTEKILPTLISQASTATIQSALQFAIQYQTKLANVIRLLQQDGPPVPSTDIKKDKDTGEKQKTTDLSPPPQKETETQTTPPSQTETETQTQGEPEPSQSQQQQQQQQQQRQIQQNPQQGSQQKAEEWESKLQKLKDQLGGQETVTQKLNDQLRTQETLTQKLDEQVRQQDVQIQQFRTKIEELEKENRELTANFDTQTKKSEASVQDFQAQIAVLQKDIELKVKKIEKVSKERDSERRAKEIAKRILSSNGPRESPDNIGHSHAIRMGSLENASSPATSPTPPNGMGWENEDSGARDIGTSTKGGDTGINGNGKNGNGVATAREDNNTTNPASTTTTPGSTPSSSVATSSVNSSPAATSDASPRQEGGGRARSNSKSGKSQVRAKDDMHIASEAERARVRRLVKRWEEMRFI